MLVPAICQNNACGTVWFTRPFGGSPSARFTLTGSNSVQGCPKCKGFGTIPDGIYTSAGISLFDQKQWQLVAAALADIRNQILGGASVDQVKESITSNNTLREYLANFVPKDLKDLQSLLVIIGILISAYSYLTSSTLKDQKVGLPAPAIELLNQPCDVKNTVSTDLQPAPSLQTLNEEKEDASPQSKDSR